MEKEPTKKRTEIMRIRRTDNRTLKDDFKSRRQLIVIRVNGWTNRGRNKKDETNNNKNGKDTYDEQKCDSNQKRNIGRGRGR